MADLTEKDKRVLFGDNYREIEAQNRLNAGVTDKQDIRKRQISFAENAKLSSYAVAIIGIGLLVSGYFRPKDSDHVITAAIGGVFLILGLAWRVYLSRRITSLTAANERDRVENLMQKAA